MTYPVVPIKGIGETISETLGGLGEALMRAHEMRRQQQADALRQLLGQSEIQSQQALVMERGAQTTEARARTASIQQQTAERVQVSASAAAQQRELQTFLGQLPEDLRVPVGALVKVGDALPADIKTAVFNRLAGRQGVDARAYGLWLSTWRTGAVTAQEAADAVGIPLPTGIRPTLKLPTTLSVLGQNTLLTGQVSRLSASLRGLNTIIDDYRAEEQRYTTTEMVRKYGPVMAKRITPTPEDRAIIQARVAGRLQRRFPKINETFQRRELLLRQLEQLSTQGVVGATPQQPDALDDLISRIPEP